LHDCVQQRRLGLARADRVLVTASLQNVLCIDAVNPRAEAVRALERRPPASSTDEMGSASVRTPSARRLPFSNIAGSLTSLWLDSDALR
jgi:hypothetical protein